MSRPLREVVVVALVVASLGTAAPSAAAGPAATLALDSAVADGGEVLVVDDDGDAEFDTIGDAVASAEDGTTIRVRPGTYRESVTVDEDVALVAPRGATLNGSTLDDPGFALRIEDDAAVVVDGFTIAHYQIGVDVAGRQSGDWELRNATIESTSYRGVRATLSRGDWTIANVTVANGSTAVDATESTGDWTVRDTVVRNASGGKAFDVSPSAGNWTIRNATVVDADLVGVAASYSTGDWRVANSTIRGTTVGIGALEATGDWTVSRTTVANASTARPYDIVKPPLRAGVGVYAARTNGSWTIRHSRFVGNDVAAVDATGASPAGDGALNWWGAASGADADDCSGNVDCDDPLTAWPPEPATAGDDGTAEVTDASGSSTGTERPGSAVTGHSTARTPLSPTLAVLALVVAGVALARRGDGR